MLLLYALFKWLPLHGGNGNGAWPQAAPWGYNVGGQGVMVMGKRHNKVNFLWGGGGR